MNIYISEKAYYKICSFNKLGNEKEWLAVLIGGKNETITDGIFVDDLFLPFQNVSSASCEVDEEKYPTEIAKLDKKTLENMIGWIHSHNTMSTFYSSTDVDTDNDLTKYFDKNKVIVSIIVNNDFDIIGKIHLNLEYGTIEFGVPIKVYREFSEDRIPASIKNQFENKVKEKVYQSWNTLNGYANTDFKVSPKFKVLTTQQIRQIIELEKEVFVDKDFDKEVRKIMKKKLPKRTKKAMVLCLSAIFNHRIRDEERIFGMFEKVNSRFNRILKNVNNIFGRKDNESFDTFDNEEREVFLENLHSDLPEKEEIHYENLAQKRIRTLLDREDYYDALSGETTTYKMRKSD